MDQIVCAARRRTRRSMTCNVVAGHSLLPPTLRMILRERSMRATASHGDLSRWATQGVLLLNRVLTVAPGAANSRKNRGWEAFTSRLIRIFLEHHPNRIVVMLWGRPAQRVRNIIGQDALSILSSSHPSPNRGACNTSLRALYGHVSYDPFTHANHFENANKELEDKGFATIDWERPWRNRRR
jgi:uracil-DNA glycosylase